MRRLEERLQGVRRQLRAAAQERFLADTRDRLVLVAHRRLVEIGALEDPDGRVEALLQSQPSRSVEEIVAAAAPEEQEEVRQCQLWLQSLSADELHQLLLPSTWDYFKAAAPAFGLPGGRERVLAWVRALTGSDLPDLLLAAELDAQAEQVRREEAASS